MPGTQIAIKSYHVEILLLSRSELFSQLACHYTSFGFNSQSFRYKPPWLFINIHQGIFIVFNKILNRCIKRSLEFTYNIIINNVASGTDSTASHRCLPVHLSTSFLIPSAKKLQILIILHILQTVNALDLNTYHRLDAFYTFCFLSLLHWRPHFVRSQATTRQLQLILLLLMLPAVQSLDSMTCTLLNTIFTCLLLLLSWRPLIVLIPVALVVVILLFWCAAHSAYHALSEALVNIAIYLVSVCLFFFK
jgi:hypothetical protein